MWFTLEDKSHIFKKMSMFESKVFDEIFDWIVMDFSVLKWVLKTVYFMCFLISRFSEISVHLGAETIHKNKSKISSKTFDLSMSNFTKVWVKVKTCFGKKVHVWLRFFDEILPYFLWVFLHLNEYSKRFILYVHVWAKGFWWNFDWFLMNFSVLK